MFLFLYFFIEIFFTEYIMIMVSHHLSHPDPPTYPPIQLLALFLSV